ncbi:hypothetical protein PF003_g17669 [Phytophthora fragariae]|nr:hypothetical protein PF003_g17669 [Phytophthora fragariae]
MHCVLAACGALVHIVSSLCTARAHRVITACAQHAFSAYLVSKAASTISSASSSAGSSSSSADPASKTLSTANLTYTLVNFCDSDDVCSEVCEAGTALIKPWVARAITYQRTLSYVETLCYAELPATHNRVITRDRGYGNRDQLNAKLGASSSASYMRTSNWFLSLTDQLDLGMRFLELDVNYFASSLCSAH